MSRAGHFSSPVVEETCVQFSSVSIMSTSISYSRDSIAALLVNAGLLFLGLCVSLVPVPCSMTEDSSLACGLYVSQPVPRFRAEESGLDEKDFRPWNLALWERVFQAVCGCCLYPVFGIRLFPKLDSQASCCYRFDEPGQSHLEQDSRSTGT